MCVWVGAVLSVHSGLCNSSVIWGTAAVVVGNTGITDSSARRLHRTITLRVCPQLKVLRLRGTVTSCLASRSQLPDVMLAAASATSSQAVA
jgi:hypothetical protein